VRKGLLLRQPTRIAPIAGLSGVMTTAPPRRRPPFRNRTKIPGSFSADGQLIAQAAFFHRQLRPFAPVDVAARDKFDRRVGARRIGEAEGRYVFDRMRQTRQRPSREPPRSRKDRCLPGNDRAEVDRHPHLLAVVL